MATNPLPGVRRVVTGHNINGEATVIKDDVLPVPSNVHRVYRSEEYPVRNDAELRGSWTDVVAESDTVVARGGVASRIYDMAPGDVVVRIPCYYEICCG